ncbi:MetQ/NlpA family ABC transporter substrate-binding protein [Bifidobacterium biavatii]|uniref:Outer membrane lipoprotein n=1 Tax=Bifidobacterium biavatii DSM 23969 TaxID=1437608 RepID=A0A087A0H9_9BIFI|nr:MetQ/NlpA family ABC transporter substrate-binding protein [Bifidobacterium biavatii]KFI52279.1 outer membrane lipoprotein [Bifidobacterium biavatii DSM 23969]
MRRTGIRRILEAAAAVTATIGVLIAAGCGATGSATDADGNKIIKVSISGTSFEPVWKLVNENLKKEKAGLQVKTVSVEKGIYGNQALSQGEVDLSAQQNYAFLNGEIKEKGYKFTPIAETIISPLNIFSDTISSVADVKDGDKVLIPNDPVNIGRALEVLQDAKLITIDPAKDDPAKGLYPHEDDITSNPKHLNITPVDKNMVMPSLKDAAIGIANADAVVDYGKNPVTDAIYAVEPDPKNPQNKPWINVIVARTEDKDNPDYRKIITAYHQDNVKQLINTLFKGGNIPVW